MPMFLFPSKMCLDYNLSTRNEWESTVVRSLIGKNIVNHCFSCFIRMKLK